METSQTKMQTMLNGNLVFISIIVSLMNSFYYDNYFVMLVLVVLEIILLFKFMLLSQYTKFLSYFIVFLSTSLESSTFVGVEQFYGFKNFSIFGMNLGLLTLLVFLFVLLLKGVVKEAFRIHGYVKTFVYGGLLISLIALCVGLINFVIDDNGISTRENSLGIFINASYMYIFVVIEMIIIVSVIGYSNNDMKEIKQSLFAVIISIAVTLIASYIFGNYGNRGGLQSLQVSNLVMLLVCTVLLPLYSVIKKHEKIILGLSGGVIFVLGIIYNANGKMVIIGMLIPLMSLYILLKNRKYLIATLTSLIAIIGGLVISVVLPLIKGQSIIFKEKLYQAFSLLEFWKSDWLDNMSESPKIRISQIMNISAEYLEKPWYFIWGKGIMGSIKDHLMIFGDINEFTYSSWELNNAIYFAMHETFNSLYLSNGLIGIVFFVVIMKVIVQNINKSPWLLVGGFWFLMFYVYSVTISIYGVTALIVGLYELNGSQKTGIKGSNEKVWSDYENNRN